MGRGITVRTDAARKDCGQALASVTSGVTLGLRPRAQAGREWSWVVDEDLAHQALHDVEGPLDVVFVVVFVVAAVCLPFCSCSSCSLS